MAHKVKSHLETEGYLTTKNRLIVQDGLFDNNTQSGTSGQVLSKNEAGQVIWADAAGGGVDGSGTANKITKWSDTDTLAASSFMNESATGVEFGTDAMTYVHTTKRVGIATTTPSVSFDCAGAAKFQSKFYDGSDNLAGDGQVLTGTSAGETLWKDPIDLAYKVAKTYYINCAGGSSGTFYLQHHGDEVTFSLNYESLFPVPSAGSLEKLSIVSSASYTSTTWSLIDQGGSSIWTSGSISLVGNVTTQLTPSSATFSATDRIGFKLVRGTTGFPLKIAVTAIFAFDA